MAKGAVIVLAMLGVVGLWLMDLGNLSPYGDLCNGWVCIGASRGFHLGLYMNVGSLGLLAILALGRRRLK